MSSTQTHKPRAKNFGALLNASSELEQLRQENELLKIENEQLKRQIEQWKESIKRPSDRINTLEEIIEERDEDIETLKKEIGQSDLSAALVRESMLNRTSTEITRHALVTGQRP